ncbi:INO80 complex subunit E [Spea bombifrons]|uniref:INO80 complex subunit E n=1 Tax=Spea bombifrons TaxID=233779 RepID=UPI00234B1B19|nr:INO80 complex subunit E [Spea bombifrons]
MSLPSPLFPGAEMNGPGDGEVDYKRKYKNLKRKLKFLVYEQECFQEELRRAQRKLLKVSRDKSFLLDRVLLYENVDDDSSDSDVTASSDNSDTEGVRGTVAPSAKRKRSPPAGQVSSPPSSSTSLSLHAAGGTYMSAMNSPPYTPFPSEYLAPLPNTTPPKPERPKKDRKNRWVKSKKPKIPLGSPTGCGNVLPFGSRASALTPLSSSSKLTPPPTILSTVPQQMFSDGGEGSGDEGPLDGDEEDDLVIDIPE